MGVAFMTDLVVLTALAVPRATCLPVLQNAGPRGHSDGFDGSWRFQRFLVMKATSLKLNPPFPTS